ncbi:MAG: DUF2079 domain-containing protein, partial [Anaerolineae bacterium]|nr:DUF2079 domain-containing protein [Anaerolineae bacterium]
MSRETRRLAEVWLRWGAWVQAGMFILVFFALSVLKHDSFHTRALDLAKFDQAIWNTLHGRFLFSTMQNQSILANHFSLFMAFLSPLFLIWNDVRVLFLVQTVGLAASGLFLYRIVRSKHERIAPWFLLAFYLNPALHEVALVEFRRVTLAVPFLAMALYALYAKKRRLMAVGLAVALLCKEDIALIVSMVGLYLILFERDWAWGVLWIVVGAAWAVAITFWVIPQFALQIDAADSLYSQLNYFGLSGDSYGEVLQGVLRDPFVFFRHMFDGPALRALWRIFLPLGLVLPFAAPRWMLIVLPAMALMLMSTAPGMHRLEDWYSASVLPGLFAAVAVSLTRLPARKARWAVAGLLLTAVIGYLCFSHAPLGGGYKPELYQVTDHHRLAAQAVDLVSAGASVAAQDPYVPHLAHREHIYLYPWIALGEENIEYFILDRHLHPYPLQPHEMNAQIDDMVADTSLVIEFEADGIYVFHRGGEPLAAFPVDAVAGDTMRLQRAEVAVADSSGVYRVADRSPVLVERGQIMRVSLYWQALAAPKAERTVSVRLVLPGGSLLAQQDNMPGRGKKPTSWWQEGWQIRDVYDLTVSPDAPPGAGTLDVLVYDSYDARVLPFDGDRLRLSLCD